MSTKKAVKVISTRVTAEEYDKLKEIAGYRNVSISELIKIALDEMYFRGKMLSKRPATKGELKELKELIYAELTRLWNYVEILEGRIKYIEKMLEIE